MPDQCNACAVRLEWLAIQLRSDGAPDYLGKIADQQTEVRTVRERNSELVAMLAGLVVAAFLAEIGGANV